MSIPRLALLAWLCAAPALAQGALDDSTTTRPDSPGTPTKVSIGVFILDLAEIDDLKQEFTADVMANISWQDSRLASPDSADPERILPLAEVWNPQVGILNRRDITTMMPEQVRVDRAGNVLYSQRVLGQFASRLDLRRFPADTQRLEIRMASYRYGPEEVEVEVDSGRTGRLPEVSGAGWTVGQPVVDSTPLGVPGGQRAGVTLQITVARETGYYVLTIALPLLLIALMAWTVFWIDPSLLPSQVGISTGSVFSLIAFRLGISMQLPRVSYLNTADWVILSVTLLVFVALGESILTGRLAKTGRADLARRIDAVGRWVYLVALVLVVGWAVI